MRKFVIATLMFTMVGLTGCGSAESTNPDELPPLTAADLEEIRQQDAEIEAEEQAPL